MKIISNKAWEAILDIARESDRKINELTIENMMLKSDLKDLQTMYNTLKEAMITKTIYVDFPATKKLHEDTNY